MLEMAVRQRPAKNYVHALLDGREPRQKRRAFLQRMRTNAPPSARDASPPSSAVSSLWTGITAGTGTAGLRPAHQAKRRSAQPLRLAGLQQAYARDENDEFIQATVIGEKVGMQDGDVAVFMNSRRRARANYPRSDRHRVRWLQPSTLPRLASFVTKQLWRRFPSAHSLRTGLDQHGFGRIYLHPRAQAIAHRRKPKNTRTSPISSTVARASLPRRGSHHGAVAKVLTYDLKPEMSAFEVTDKLEEAIRSGKLPVHHLQYANGDMVGHSRQSGRGDQAIEALDICIGRW